MTKEKFSYPKKGYDLLQVNQLCISKLFSRLHNENKKKPRELISKKQ